MYIKENKATFTNLLTTQKLKSEQGRTEARKHHVGLWLRGQHADPHDKCQGLTQGWEALGLEQGNCPQ